MRVTGAPSTSRCRARSRRPARTAGCAAILRAGAAGRLVIAFRGRRGPAPAPDAARARRTGRRTFARMDFRDHRQASATAPHRRRQDRPSWQPPGIGRPGCPRPPPLAVPQIASLLFPLRAERADVHPGVERAEGLLVARAVEPALDAVRAGCALVEGAGGGLDANPPQLHAGAAVVEVDVDVDQGPREVVDRQRRGAGEASEVAGPRRLRNPPPDRAPGPPRGSFPPPRPPPRRAPPRTCRSTAARRPPPDRSARPDLHRRMTVLAPEAVAPERPPP